MDWLCKLLFEEGVAHTVLLLAFVVAVGIMLGKIKICGVSPGITMVLFAGITVSHFGFRVEHHLLHFVREFGLILFVFAVGLQVGPGFFASFKKGGIRLNMLAMCAVVLGVLVTVILHFVTGIPIPTMVGIMSGAVTNTPGLGAAQEASADVSGGMVDPTIALGYAVAYPLGVVGIILSIISIRYIFRIRLDIETGRLQAESDAQQDSAETLSLAVKNPAIFGSDIKTISELISRKFVISRVCHEDGHIEIASSQTVLNGGDKVLVVTSPAATKAITAFIGTPIDMSPADWKKLDSALVSRRILITRSEINGRTLGRLKLRAAFGINITRINRSGLDLIAQPGLQLQLGDRVTVVGSEQAIAAVEKVLGNKMQRLNEPNLIPIFIGIVLGVLLGSIPFAFPGIPQPVKLGMAGGPLIVAILISVFGPKYKLVTYTTMSANLMLREIGICLFLACVGLGAGENFVKTIVEDGGVKWIGLGFIITVLPLVITGVLGRSMYKLNYYTLMGLLAGSATDPPALSYANTAAGNDAPAVGYATVYPFTMFLRVLFAQLLILLF
ncbi:MAG: putative transporter [Bacteroidales bacterium]|nr:putative transporter [Bacteroidales bacterium]